MRGSYVLISIILLIVAGIIVYDYIKNLGNRKYVKKYLNTNESVRKHLNTNEMAKYADSVCESIYDFTYQMKSNYFRYSVLINSLKKECTKEQMACITKTFESVMFFLTDYLLFLTVKSEISAYMSRSHVLMSLLKKYKNMTDKESVSYLNELITHFDFYFKYKNKMDKFMEKSDFSALISLLLNNMINDAISEFYSSEFKNGKIINYSGGLYLYDSTMALETFGGIIEYVIKTSNKCNDWIYILKQWIGKQKPVIEAY